jgi:tetratricopeptide (TPR) repeat protein
MPTINKLFLLKLLLAVVAVVGGLAGVHTVQARRLPDALKRQADRSVDQGKTDAAVHYLRRYLEFRPADLAALERLAGLLKERPKGDPADLILLYDKVLRADPGRTAVRRDALVACLKLNRFTDAEAHAQTLLRDEPANAELYQQLAAAQAGLQKSAETRASYEQAIKHAPGDPVPYQRLAQYLWLDLKQPAEAKAVIDRLVAAAPHDPEAYLTRAKFDQYAGDGSTAMADLTKALELDPENADGLLMLAEQYQKRRKLAEARDCLADGLRLYPHNVKLVRSLAWLELNRGNVGAAVAVLEDGLTRVKDGFDLLGPLADLLVQLGETARTEAIVKRLEARPGQPAKLQVKYLRGRLAMRAGEWASAAELFNALRAESVRLPGLESQATFLLAVCQQQQGDTTREQETLKLLLNKDPNHLAGRVTLAQSYLNAGRIGEAVKEYEQAVRSPQASPSTHGTLLRLKARELATTAARPTDWAQLDRVAAELQKVAGPAAVEPVLIRAELLAARGDRTQAATVLRAEAARRPGDTRVWAALATAVADLAGTAAGLGVLDEAQAAAGDGPDLRIARADLSARDPARLRPLDPLAAQIETWPDADQVRLLYGLAEVFDRLGDDARVIAAYRQIAARRPADLSVWHALGERAARSGDAKAFDAALAAAVKLDPSGKTAALFDGWAAVAGNKADAARAAITGLTKAYGANPDRADACIALARLKAVAGESGEAGRLFERATRLEPNRFPPMQAYFTHLASAGADDAVVALLTRFSRDHRWSGEPLRRVVQAAVQRLPSDAARRVLTAARPVVEPEPGGLGWLGDVYLACGFKPDAERCFEQATLAPTVTADDWLRLAVRSAEGGSPSAAVKVMQAAKEKLPPAVYFATAASFAESAAAPAGWSPVVSSPADVRQFTQARLGVRLSRFQRTESIELIEKYLATEPPAEDAAWANRNLAMLLAVRAKPGDRKKAMDLLLAADNSAGASADDKRSTAAVLTALSRHLDGADRKAVLDRATAVLKSVVDETRTTRDAYLLAQLYRAGGKRPESVQVLNQLLQADPKNLDYLVMALEELVEDGKHDAAGPFAERLLALHPTEFRAVAAVARAECRAGRPERAAVVAEGYTRTADATAGDLPAKSARAAELLDELARLPGVRRTDAGRRMARAAVEKYEALAATRPEAVIAAAGLLAMDDRTAEAFAVIDKFAGSMTPRLKAAAGLAVLRAGGGGDRAFAQVRQWLDAALAEEPAAVGVRLNLAEYHTLRHEFGEAERVYQSVLDDDPKNVVALNNLAWVLAPNPRASARALELIDRAAAEVGLTGELLDTRARVRIAARQFEPAERDLHDALSQEKTPLRLFHLALAKETQAPPRKGEAREAFRQAKERGLDPRAVHPVDLPAYRSMDAELPRRSMN